MELFDLYTADRVKTGRTMARGEPVPENCYRLVVHVCIFDPAGRMLIQQRQPFKDGWSNLWDLTVGGSAVAGETSPEAAERELAEELGLKSVLHAARPALTIHFRQGFDDIYLIDAEPQIADLRFQYEEVQAARWCGKDGINRNLSAPVAGICFLHRGDTLLQRLSPAEAAIDIIRQTQYYQRDKKNTQKLLSLIDLLAKEVPVFSFHNHAQPEDASLTYAAMSQAIKENTP